MRVVVVGASSGLGRGIGVGLGQRGAHVALLARRRDRLDAAAAEAGSTARAIECDVTDEASVYGAVERAATELGGIDGLVYTPAIGPLVRLRDTDASTWRRVFDTNVTGAALVTAAALPHLESTGGTAVFLSSVTASQTPPWPGLGAYAVSKAALDKLVEAWRQEYPHIGFTRCVVGDSDAGDGDGATGFADEWDHSLLAEFYALWVERGLVTGEYLDLIHLVDAVEGVLRAGPKVSMPTIVVAPRPRARDTDHETRGGS